uniref:Uncharacterized protein n=1 Tax=Rhizophora mucronata TaxID=61149 RepID=A0A2P2PJT5_RHIMU
MFRIIFDINGFFSFQDTLIIIML